MWNRSSTSEGWNRSKYHLKLWNRSKYLDSGTQSSIDSNRSEPGSGGETCIALSHVIYERMQQKHPKLVEEMEEKGLIYTRVLGEESDPSSPVGRSWKETFMTDDKNVAEE
nr:clavaminate synthase-like protein At3g21360 [Tanacetum cinerariifolium]